MKLLTIFLLLLLNLSAITLPKHLQNNEILDRLEDKEAVQVDPKKWIFVIGVGDYDNTDNIKYSVNSAKTFIKVMQKTMGIHKRRTYAITGDKATSGTIKSELKNLLDNIKEGDSIYFYYSGHGVPALQTKDPYILPKDLSPAIVSLEEDFKLKNIYAKLESSVAGKVIAIVDSCFSGSTDGKSLFKGVAASRLVSNRVRVNHAKMAIITAGKDKEFSNMYEDKAHRLFSYYVMDAILKGKTDVKSLFTFTRDKVKETSFEFGDQYKQTPTFDGNKGLSL